MANTLIVVMAKGKSTRVPEKNIAPIGDRRLIDFTFEHIAGIQTPIDVTVLTESRQVADCCGERHISWEEPGGGQGEIYARVEKAVQALEDARGQPYRYVILLQPDSPLRPPRLTDDAVWMLDKTGCDIVVSVVRVPVKYHAFRSYFIRTPGDLAPLSLVDQEQSSHTYPHHYVLTGGIYALSRSHLRKAASRGGMFYGVHARPLMTDVDDFVEIDHPEDLDAFRRRIASGNIGRVSRPVEI